MPSKAKFTTKTKKEIFDRDWGCCIICWTNQWILDFHHVYYWSESNYWPDRNKTNQWVTICRENCHPEAHAFKRGGGIRQDCINYSLKI